jgi:methylphosphotriester-DNA--protein-cysteine methyltransferase
MSQLRQHTAQQQPPVPGGGDSADSAAATRLAAARDRLDRVYAAADDIIERIGLADSARFLDQVRQSGGQ